MYRLAQTLILPGQQDTPAVLQGPVNASLFGGELTAGSILSRAVPFVFAFAGIGLLLMIIMGGFTLLTSAGESKKMEQGKQTLTFAIVGFLIIFTAFWIVQIVGKIFGLTDILNIFSL